MNIRTEVMNVVAKACNYSSVPKIALPEDLH